MRICAVLAMLRLRSLRGNLHALCKSPAARGQVHGLRVQFAIAERNANSLCHDKALCCFNGGYVRGKSHSGHLVKL